MQKYSSDPVSINIYPALAHEEDLTPDCGVEFDTICEEIRSATKGFGCDKARLIQSLGATIPEDRLKISLRYKDLYEKALKDVIKKEVSGDFGTAMKYLSLPPVEAECQMIKHACKGIGSHQAVLYSILCGRSNKDMELLKKTYYKMFTTDLTGVMSSELGGMLGGNFWKLISASLQAAEETFDPDFHTEEKAAEDAEQIWKKGQGKFFGASESTIFKVIVLSPPKYLKMVNEAYADKYGYTLEKAMDKNLGGNAEKAAIFTINMRFKPYEAIAEVIKSACAGIGTDELLLTCCVIRYQDIMAHVNFAHEEMFGKSVHDRIRSECGGVYKDLLLELMKKVCPEE